MLSPLVTQANGYQNRQMSAKRFSELASYSNTGCRGQMNSRLPELASGHGPLTSQSAKGSQEPLPAQSQIYSPKTAAQAAVSASCLCQLHSTSWSRHLGLLRPAKGRDQDCSPVNESFSHPGMLKCPRGTWTHTLVSAQICLNAKPCCFLPTTSKENLKQSHQLQGRMGRKPQAATPILAEQNL